MFTGIIEVLGKVRAVETISAGRRFQIQAPEFYPFQKGESIAVNGACLTVVDFDPDGFSAEVIPETLEKTTLGLLVSGDSVHLERALRVGDRLGGHFVQGHVDGVGRVDFFDSKADRVILRIVPREVDLLNYLAPKGSVTLNGVNLTVTRVNADFFEVELIPHTLEQTLFHRLQVGDEVNIEVDALARVVSRLLKRQGLI